MNAIVRLPAGITATQSFSWVLRETFLAILAPLFPGYTILRNNQVPIQRAQLPVLGVYLLAEKMTPDGDWNAGDIRFIHDFQIGFSVIIANNDGDVAEQILDAAWWTLMKGLWSNAGLMNLAHSTNVDNTRTEGVMLAMRRFVYGAVGLNNETPVAELQYEATCRYRSEWPPIIPDELLTIHVETVPIAGPSGEPVPPADEVQRIISEYDFTPTKGGTDGRRTK